MSKQLKKFEFEFPLIKIGKDCVGGILVNGECGEDNGEAFVDWCTHSLTGKATTHALVEYFIENGTGGLERATQSHCEAVLRGEIISKQQAETLEEREAA